MIEKSKIENIKTELSEARRHKAELEEAFKLAESSRSKPVKLLAGGSKTGPSKTVNDELKEAADAFLMESYRVDCLSRKVKQMERQNEIETIKYKKNKELQKCGT